MLHRSARAARCWLWEPSVTAGRLIGWWCGEGAVIGATRGWRAAAAPVIAAALLVGCSTGSDSALDDATEDADPAIDNASLDGDRDAVDIAPLRQALQDLEPASSPQQLVDFTLHDAIVRGRLRTVLPGGGAAASEEDDAPEQYVILLVDLEEVDVAIPDLGLDDTAYVVLFQGAWRGGQPEYSLDDWNRAVPSGTEMLLFLRRTNVGMVNRQHGIPADAIGTTPISQGLIPRDGDGLLGGLVDLDPGWTELSWEALAEQVATATTS